MVDEFKNLYIYPICKIFNTFEATLDASFNASTYVFQLNFKINAQLSSYVPTVSTKKVYNAINSSESYLLGILNSEITNIHII